SDSLLFQSKKSMYVSESPLTSVALPVNVTVNGSGPKRGSALNEVTKGGVFPQLNRPAAPQVGSAEDVVWGTDTDV
ncbi:MAG: hypothetical protein NTW48_09095, partial [Chloroflexi bacterium]|nr:hypothetical protein [Chloroflexota bacterium]